MFKPELVGALPGYVGFNYGGCVGNRALSEVRATKPLRSCALLKVQLFLFLDVEIYLLHWSRGSPGTVHVFLSCSQTLLLRVILHLDNISDLLLWFLFCMLTWMGQLREYNMPNVKSIIYVNPVTLEVSGVFAFMTQRLGLWWEININPSLENLLPTGPDAFFLKVLTAATHRFIGRFGIIPCWLLEYLRWQECSALWEMERFCFKSVIGILRWSSHW